MKFVVFTSTNTGHEIAFNPAKVIGVVNSEEGVWIKIEHEDAIQINESFDEALDRFEEIG